jgi:hypothetical protein
MHSPLNSGIAPSDASDLPNVDDLFNASVPLNTGIPFNNGSLFNINIIPDEKLFGHADVMIIRNLKKEFEPLIKVQFLRNWSSIVGRIY